MSTRELSPELKRLHIRRIRITGWTALSALMTTIVAGLAWAHVVYPADREATIAVWQDPRVEISTPGRAVVLSPTADSKKPLSDWVLVFYPGAKVDPFSYLAPFVDLVGDDGLRVVIPEPPLNLAFTVSQPASELAALAGDYQSLAVGGHSLGGVKACLEADSADVRALLLQASYCANDLSATSLSVLTVLGSRDGLTDSAVVDEAAGLLPDGHTTLVIDGANHASFGSYGPQAGDGSSMVSPEEMRIQLTAALREFFASGD